MKTYITDIIPKIKKFSQKLDNLTLLTNQHWVAIDDIENIKSVYIFRDNKELLIALNGKVEKAKWDYLGFNSLLIDKEKESFLFKHGFFDENILALKLDSKNEYAFLVNETKFNAEINSIDSINQFLTENYLNSNIKSKILKDKKYTPEIGTAINLNYKIIREFEGWGLSTGKYITYEVVFENLKSLHGKMFLIKETGKYFHKGFDKVPYFDKFEECAESLGRLLIKEK